MKKLLDNSDIKIAPCSKEAEEAVIGAILLDANVFDSVRKTQHFTLKIMS